MAQQTIIDTIKNLDIKIDKIELLNIPEQDDCSARVAGVEYVEAGPFARITFPKAAIFGGAEAAVRTVILDRNGQRCTWEVIETRMR